MDGTVNADSEVIDFGCHIYAEEMLPRNQPDNPDAGLDELLGPVHHDPDVLLDRFDEAGVDRAVLSQPYYMGHGDREMVAAANDALLEMIEREDRFYGLAALPVAAGGQAAAEEFERCLDEGYNGGALETRSDGVELTDDEVEPVLEVANERNAPLLVHPKIDDSLHPETLDDIYQLNAVFGREVALSAKIFEVIHRGILDQYPDLDLVFHHLGGNIAAMLGRAHLRLDPGRWPGQEAVKSFEEFTAQLEERVYLDTSGFFGYRAPVETALEELPSTQILFGTDHPYEPRTPEELATCVEAVRGVASTRDAERVLSENVRGLLVNVS